MLMSKSWLNEKLSEIEAEYESAVRHLQMERAASRLGPELTIFDIDFTSTVRISSDRLSMRSQGSFNTVKANACVFGGKWMYEVGFHAMCTAIWALVFAF